MRPNYTRRYLIFGAILGLAAPISASIIDMLFQGLPLTLSHLFQVQASNPLLWVIDSTPLVLGLVAAFAGRRQEQVAAINEELEDKFIERQQMVAKLVALQNNLEHQVEARTADLNLRKSQFEAAAQVASATAGILKLDVLLDQAADLISKNFGFYHTGIFLVDETRKFLVLEAASSPGGKRMLAQKYRLEIEKIGPAGTGELRGSRGASVDAVYFKNPELPETRSSLVIPLTIQDKLIGVLDIQAKTPGAFTHEDINALQLVGDQIAMAIETSHLLEEKQAALDEMDRAHQELTQQSWFQSFRTQPDIAFRCDSHGHILPLQELGPPSWEIGEPANSEDRPAERALALPLKIRDQIVGEIRFRKPAVSETWTEDEISLLETLTDQVSVAMDSARLYRDSQRQAERERLVADITTKLRESNDPQQIMRTAVHELQTALRAQRAQIKFQAVDGDERGPAARGNGSDDAGSKGSNPEGAS